MPRPKNQKERLALKAKLEAEARTTRTPEPAPEPSIDLSTLKKPELVALAAERGVEIDPKAKKAELIEALS